MNVNRLIWNAKTTLSGANPTFYQHKCKYNLSQACKYNPTLVKAGKSLGKSHSG